MSNDNKTTPGTPFIKGELIPLTNDTSIDSPLEKGDEGGCFFLAVRIRC